MNTTTTTNVPKALALLAKAGYQQQFLADQVGVKPATVARWAAGRQRPRPKNLARLADVVMRQRRTIGTSRLNMRVDDLLFRAAIELETPQQRAEVEATAARLAADFAARDAVPYDREAEIAKIRELNQRMAEVGDRAARQRQGKAPIPVAYKVADPFDLIPQEEPLPF